MTEASSPRLGRLNKGEDIQKTQVSLGYAVSSRKRDSELASVKPWVARKGFVGFLQRAATGSQQSSDPRRRRSPAGLSERHPWSLDVNVRGQIGA